MVDYKRFNTHVVTPHEAFMALKPDIFPWESKITTHFGELLARQELDKQGTTHDLADIYAHEYAANDEQALVALD